MCADARGREIDFCHMLMDVRVWVWICMWHVCKCTCEIRARSVTVNKPKDNVKILKSWSLFPEKKKKKRESKSILWFKFMYCAHERERESFFSTRRSPQTQPTKQNDKIWIWIGRLEYVTHTLICGRLESDKQVKGDGFCLGYIRTTSGTHSDKDTLTYAHTRAEQ